MYLSQPETAEEFAQYYELRWRILRKPWGQPRGSEQDMEESDAYHIMAVDNDQVLAVARLQFPLPSQAQLRYMAVDDQYQGQGIGRAIVKHMEQYARQQGADSLFLHARDNALGFYKSMGYNISEKSYLLFESIQHYKMQKSL
jgi:N-acetylglutamate synthase-like GNAT family acetyltransferase